MVVGSAAVVGAYDLVAEQLFSRYHSLPTIADIASWWGWYMWVIIALTSVLGATIIGFYTREKQRSHKGKGIEKRIEQRIPKQHLRHLRKILYDIQQCSEKLIDEASRYDLSSYRDAYFTDEEWFSETLKEFESQRTQMLYKLAQLPKNPRLEELKGKNETWQSLIATLDDLIPKLHNAKLENKIREYIRRLDYSGNARLWKIVYAKYSTTVRIQDIATDEEMLELMAGYPLEIYRQLIEDIDRLIEGR